MPPTISRTWRSPVEGMWTEGLLAGALSAAVRLWRGPGKGGSAAGGAVHLGSSLLWSALYSWLRSRRLRPGPKDALIDAAAVTTLAAVVDLNLVPPRLSPGFGPERRRLPGLSPVYLGFAAGLALGGLLQLRRP